jgi:hypothetical protein
MDRRSEVREPDYEPPLDKECGIMFVLETEEEVRRFVAANGGTGRQFRSLNRTCTQNDGI